MPSNTYQNIYFEQFVSNCTQKELWTKIIQTKAFKSLFLSEAKTFNTGDQGELVWKKKYFFPIKGQYLVDSLQEGSHLLLKISTNDFSSLLLLTFEENNQGTLFRLDHRSFVGNGKVSYKKSFKRRWNHLFKQFKENK